MFSYSIFAFGEEFLMYKSILQMLYLNIFKDSIMLLTYVVYNNWLVNNHIILLHYLKIKNVKYYSEKINVQII